MYAIRSYYERDGHGAVAPPAGEPIQLGRKDFVSDQEVRWCPGCGDYAILKAVERTLAELQADLV